MLAVRIHAEVSVRAAEATVPGHQEILTVGGRDYARPLHAEVTAGILGTAGNVKSDAPVVHEQDADDGIRSLPVRPDERLHHQRLIRVGARQSVRSPDAFARLELGAELPHRGYIERGRRRRGRQYKWRLRLGRGEDRFCGAGGRDGEVVGNAVSEEGVLRLFT